MKDHDSITRRKLIAIGSTTMMGGLAGCSGNNEGEDIPTANAPEETTEPKNPEENIVYEETRKQLENASSITGQTAMTATFKSEPKGDFHHLIELTENSTTSFERNEHLARGDIVENLKIPDREPKKTEYMEYLVDGTRYIGINPNGDVKWTSQKPPENVFRISKDLFEIVPDKSSFTNTGTSQGKITTDLDQKQARAVLESLTAPEVHDNSLISAASKKEGLTATFAVTRRNFDLDTLKLTIRSSITSDDVEQNIPEKVNAEIELTFDADQFNAPFSPKVPKEAKNS